MTTRAMILAHLWNAERHVAEGEDHLARQRDIILELRKAGRDTMQAEDLLRHFEASQAFHIAGRDFLIAELAAANSAAGGSPT